MKSTIIFLALCLLTGNSLAQNAYYDAVGLMKIPEDDFKRILSVYEDVTSEEAEALRNLKKFMDDPFDPNVRRFDSDIFVVYQEAVERVRKIQNDNPHGLVNPPLMDIAVAGGAPAAGASEFATQAVSALATVIIERAKAELTLAYFDKIRKELDQLQITVGEKKVALKDLFPATVQVLGTMDVFDYRSFGHVLQTAFRRDLLDLGEAIDAKLIPENVKNNENYRLLRLGISYTKLTREGFNLPDALSKLQEQLGYQSASTGKVETIISIASLFSENLRVLNPAGKQYWIRKSDIIELGSRGQKYLLGLIYQRNKDFFNELIARAGRQPSVLFEHKEKVIELVGLLESLDQDLKLFRDTGEQYHMTSADNYFRLLNRSFDIFYHAAKIGDICIGGDVHDKVMQALPLIKIAFEIAKAIRDEDYSALLFNNLAILRHLQIPMDDNAFKKGVQFASFAAEMLNAKTAEEKRKVLEASILPPTSYRIKRTYSKTVYINAYLGFSGGGEWLEQKKWGGHASFFAPIGIETAKSSGKGSTSLLFSILDLGSIVSYRFENSQAEGVPDNFKLESVVSPGLFLVRGIKDSPISLGIGGQFNGDLRAVNGERTSSLRLGAFIAVDLTLFQLSAKE